jgi:hypothetical protein
MAGDDEEWEDGRESFSNGDEEWDDKKREGENEKERMRRRE